MIAPDGLLTVPNPRERYKVQTDAGEVVCVLREGRIHNGPDTPDYIPSELKRFARLRGLNGETIEYYQAGWDGDRLRRIEAVYPAWSGIWWELIESYDERRAREGST